MTVPLSASRVADARAFAECLVPGRRICITSHVNPDGDGLGSEVGLVHLLKARGVNAVITNPSPTPERYRFLFADLPGVDKTPEAVKELRKADLILVLDISDVGRLGMLSQTVLERGVPVACVDHHVSQGHLPDGPRYVDPEASATGELIFQLAHANGWPLTPLAARALYVAILTDTGEMAREVLGFNYDEDGGHRIVFSGDMSAWIHAISSSITCAGTIDASSARCSSAR